MKDSFKSFFSFCWEVVEVVILALVIVIPIRLFLFQPFVVDGISMEPSFHDGDYLIVDQISYRFRSPERGEVLIFSPPIDSPRPFIKRVIGLPGETLEAVDGRIQVTRPDGEVFFLEEDYIARGGAERDFSIVLEEGQYYTVGDNRNHSYDSRFWGAVSADSIIGRAAIRLFPLTGIEIIKP